LVIHLVVNNSSLSNKRKKLKPLEVIFFQGFSNFLICPPEEISLPAHHPERLFRTMMMK